MSCSCPMILNCSGLYLSRNVIGTPMIPLQYLSDDNSCISFACLSVKMVFSAAAPVKLFLYVVIVASLSFISPCSFIGVSGFDRISFALRISNCFISCWLTTHHVSKLCALRRNDIMKITCCAYNFPYGCIQARQLFIRYSPGFTVIAWDFTYLINVDCIIVIVCRILFRCVVFPKNNLFVTLTMIKICKPSSQPWYFFVMPSGVSNSEGEL